MAFRMLHTNQANINTETKMIHCMNPKRHLLDPTQKIQKQELTKIAQQNFIERKSFAVDTNPEVTNEKRGA